MPPVVQRGSLFLLKPDATGKQRPVVIVSRDQLNNGTAVLAVPFYSQQLEKRNSQPWCAPFSNGDGGLDKDCVAKGDEVSLIDKLDIDFVRGSIGRFNVPQMERVITAIKWALRVD